jgi:hypothetical protein
VSWSPAVPPPPVAGAAVGNGLAAWVGVGDGDGEGDGEGLADALAGAFALTEALAVSLGLAVGVPEIFPPGENEDAAEGVDELEQAETVAKASRVMVP